MAYTTLSKSALSFPLFLYVTFPLPTYALTVEGTQVECLKSIPAWDKVLFDKMIRKIVKLQPKHQKRLYCKSNFLRHTFSSENWFMSNECVIINEFQVFCVSCRYIRLKILYNNTDKHPNEMFKENVLARNCGFFRDTTP